LHRSFAYLKQEEQKYVNLFLHDVQGAYVVMMPDKSFRDYVTDNQCKAKDYFERLEGAGIPTFRVSIKTHTILQDFIINGGFEIL
jgi:type I restriction enzyme R subunit